MARPWAQQEGQIKVSETPEQQAAREAAEQAQADASAAAEKAADAEAARKKAEEDDPANWDKDRAARTIAAQRAEENRLKAELAEAKKAQDRLAEIEAEKLTAQERAEQEAATAKATAATATEQLRRGYLLAELAKPEHQIVDAETAADIIKGVEYGDDHKPTNLSERIEALLGAKAFLKASSASPPPPPKIDGAGGSTPGPGPVLTAEEIEAAKDAGLTADTYAANREVRTYEQWAAARKAASST